MAIREADNPVSKARPVQAVLKSDSPALKLTTFDWKWADKYQELCNFEIEVKNTFMTDNYNT